ncbi:MAG: PepSY domain-containing protein [Thiohalomonadales bacterium]
MRKRLKFVRYLIALLISVFVVRGINFVLADSDIGQDDARTLRLEGKILPLEKILENAKTIHGGKVLEAELEKKQSRYIYEIELIDENGTVWELKYDATTGSLLSTEQDH